jgi:hypothetical protein
MDMNQIALNQYPPKAIYIGFWFGHIDTNQSAINLHIYNKNQALGLVISTQAKES